MQKGWRDFEDQARGSWPETTRDCVYHFTRLETLGTMVGVDGVPRLGMTQFRDMNDPWEADPEHRGALPAQNLSRVIEELERQSRPAESTDLRSRLRSLKHARRFANVGKRAPAQLDRLARARLGFSAVCFSQDFESDPGWAQEAMWAHYAGRSAGICLVFDKRRLVEAAEREFERQRAADRRPSGGWLNQRSPRLAAVEVKYAPATELDKIRARGLSELLAVELSASYDTNNLDYLDETDGLPDGWVEAIEGWRGQHESRCARSIATLCGTKSSAWAHEREFRLVAYSLSRRGICENATQITLPTDDALVGLVVGRYAAAYQVRFFLQLLMKHADVDSLWRYDGNGALTPFGLLRDGELTLNVAYRRPDRWRPLTA